MEDRDVLEEALNADLTATADGAVAIPVALAAAPLETVAVVEGPPKALHSSTAPIRPSGLERITMGSPQELSDAPAGEQAADPVRVTEPRAVAAPRIATLEPPTPRTTGNAPPAAADVKPPLEAPNPPVVDLANETPGPTPDLPVQSQTASALAAGAQPRVGPTANRPERTERSKATEDPGSAKGVPATGRSERAAGGQAVTTAGPAETSPAPVSGHEEHAARDDSAAPDVLGSPESTINAQNAPAAGAPTHTVRGSPETVASLAAQIIKKLEGRSTRFDLELDPAGLGRVDVRIDIGARGHISAAMSFETPQAASELRARSHELRQALEQAGFDLTGGLSFDVAGDRGQARQDHQGAQQQAFRGQAFQAALDTAVDAADAAIQGALRLRRGLTSSLDLRI